MTMTVICKYLWFQGSLLNTAAHDPQLRRRCSVRRVCNYRDKASVCLEDLCGSLELTSISKWVDANLKANFFQKG